MLESKVNKLKDIQQQSISKQEKKDKWRKLPLKPRKQQLGMQHQKLPLDQTHSAQQLKNFQGNNTRDDNNHKSYV